VRTTNAARSTLDLDAGAATRQAERLAVLAHRVGEGSARAFADLYDALAGTTMRVIQSQLGDSEQAESVLYATYLEVWWMARRHDSGRGTDVAEWVNAIAIRRACERQLASRRRRAGKLADEHDTPLTQWSVDLDVVHSRLAALTLGKLLGRPLADLRPQPLRRSIPPTSTPSSRGGVDRARISRATGPAR
jgi:DNA-directed RNA polymerase specialized sigma24 family protein